MFTKSNCRIKGGFTLIELLVVIAIIVLMAALSLRGISRAVGNAKINKAMAEMTSLASTGASIYIDLRSRGYVRLADYDMVDPPAIADLPEVSSGAGVTTGYLEVLFTVSPSANYDFFNLTELQTCWDGPYSVWQAGTTSTSSIINQFPTVPPSSTSIPPGPALATVWSRDKFPTGTPLDPWRRCYGLGWNATAQVMVIYSAGLDGIMQTGCGAILVGDANADGDTTDAGDYPNSDDLIFRFR